MFISSEYKQLCKACDDGNEKEIRAWYEQIQIGYGQGMIKTK